jgi:hypothetical protein
LFGWLFRFGIRLDLLEPLRPRTGALPFSFPVFKSKRRARELQKNSRFQRSDVEWPVKFPLFVNEVLVHEESASVGIAKVTYYPIDGMLKNIRIGLELCDGERREFPLVELRRASPDEESTLQFSAENDAE